jgi:hypothetical protein
LIKLAEELQVFNAFDDKGKPTRKLIEAVFKACTKTNPTDATTNPTDTTTNPTDQTPETIETTTKITSDLDKVFGE